MSIQTLKQWIKNQDHWLSKRLYKYAKSLRRFEIPPIKIIYLPLSSLFKLLHMLFSNTIRVFLSTPMFKTRLTNNPKNLYLYGGIPLVMGNLQLSVGDDCRISAQSTFSGRASNTLQPQLIIGNNVGIGWQTTIAVGTKVKIGNNVRISGRSFLAGYPGHPVNPIARAQGLPDADSQAKDIVLEDNVWLATGVFVMAGVTIGKNTIVAAGSVVTQDLPANIIAAGSPAKKIKDLDYAE